MSIGRSYQIIYLYKSSHLTYLSPLYFVILDDNTFCQYYEMYPIYFIHDLCVLKDFQEFNEENIYEEIGLNDAVVSLKDWAIQQYYILDLQDLTTLMPVDSKKQAIEKIEQEENKETKRYEVSHYDLRRLSE